MRNLYLGVGPKYPLAVKQTKYEKTQISLATRYKLAADYCQGMSLLDLTTTYGLTEWSVRYIVRRLGCPLRPRCFKGKIADQWCEKYGYN